MLNSVNPALLTAVLALALPASASAFRGQQPPPAMDWLPRFEQAAMQYWGHGQPPECGAPHYSWSSLPGDDVGEAAPWSCTVTFDASAWHAEDPPMWCVVEFHELGHLYGHGHAGSGIMAPDITQVGDPLGFAPCRRLIKVIHYVAVNPQAPTVGYERTAYRPR